MCTYIHVNTNGIIIIDNNNVSEWDFCVILLETLISKSIKWKHRIYIEFLPIHGKKAERLNSILNFPEILYTKNVAVVAPIMSTKYKSVLGCTI